jgi:hypothetical protein
MDMKKLLTIVSGQDKKQLNESMAECGMPPQSNIPTTPPVSMNMSLNAQGVDQIKELLGLMSQADAARMSPPMAMPAAGMDMPIKISGPEEGPREPEMKDLIKIAGGEKEEFANEPDARIGDLDDAVPSGDDLHKEKKMFKKAQDGDNPMAVEGQLKSTLMKLYQEIKEGKKSKPDFLDVDKDGDKKEPMKKAVADKEKTDEALDMNLLKSAQGAMKNNKKDKESDDNVRKPYGYRGASGSEDDSDDKKAKAKAKAKK